MTAGLVMVVLTDLPRESGGASTTELTPAEDVIRYSDNSQTVIKMEITTGVFDTRHPDNTEVLLALLTQNKELEGEEEVVRDDQSGLKIELNLIDLTYNA